MAFKGSCGSQNKMKNIQRKLHRKEKSSTSHLLQSSEENITCKLCTKVIIWRMKTTSGWAQNPANNCWGQMKSPKICLDKKGAALLRRTACQLLGMKVEIVDFRRVWQPAAQIDERLDLRKKQPSSGCRCHTGPSSKAKLQIHRELNPLREPEKLTFPQTWSQLQEKDSYPA